MPLPESPDLIFHFDEVEQAVKMVEEAIEKAQRGARDKNLEARREFRARGNPEGASHADDPTNAPLLDELFHTALTFPHILRGAMLIAICSHTEYTLRQWCDLLWAEWRITEHLAGIPTPFHREWKPRQNGWRIWRWLVWKVGLGRKPKEQHPSDLERMMLYLGQETDLKLGNFKGWREWALIDAYRVARNCLAHNGGIVHDNEKKLGTLKARNISIDKASLLTDQPMLFINAGACEDAIKAARLFFKKLSAICQADPRAKT